MKPQIVHDTRIDRREEIVGYMHCTRCLQEIPDGEAPMTWARLNVGITGTGEVQVWCVRHAMNVDIMRVQLPEDAEVA
jgi:hypothetical protein